MTALRRASLALALFLAGCGGSDAPQTAAAPPPQAAPVAPQSRPAGPLYASRQAHEWLEKSITRGHWVNPDATGYRPELVSVPGKGRGAMKSSVAMAANGGRTPQRGRVQL